MSRSSIRSGLIWTALVVTSLSCQAITISLGPVPEPTRAALSTPLATEEAARPRPTPAPAIESPTARATTTPSSGAVSETSSPLPPTPAELSSQIDIHYDFYGEVITGLYHLYGGSIDSLVIFTIANRGTKTAQLRIESEILGFTSPAVDTLFAEPGESYKIEQNPVFLATAIDGLQNQRPASLSVQIHLVEEQQEVELYHETDPVLLYSRRDFPDNLSPERPFVFVAKYIAAWVTPNDPSIEQLLRYAAARHKDGYLASGYLYSYNDQNNDLFDRLNAIWNAITYDYNIKYVSTVVTFAPGAHQRIRLPAEVLQQRAGNCIELSLLLASAAEALELETEIIYVPGHAYMGVQTGEVGSNYYFIESTMIGDTSLREAIKEGNREFNEINSKNYTAGEGYFKVKISESRQLGILPMPWK